MINVELLPLILTDVANNNNHAKYCKDDKINLIYPKFSCSLNIHKFDVRNINVLNLWPLLHICDFLGVQGFIQCCWREMKVFAKNPFPLAVILTYASRENSPNTQPLPKKLHQSKSCQWGKNCSRSAVTCKISSLLWPN